jgi:pseudouridine-5'-phosphate glycosidase
VPPPEDVAISWEVINQSIEQALKEAQAASIKGQSVTPYLLKRVAELTHGSSLRANLALLRNNAQVAGRIANCMR